MYRKGMLVDTANFKEDDHLDAKAFYMNSLNGMVKKCVHGQFDVQNDNSGPIRCIHCNAKLLPNEVPESRKNKPTSQMCCMNGQIKSDGKPWQPQKLQDPPQLIKDLFSGQIDPYFKQNSRKYNNALACASIGIDDEVVQKYGWSPNVKIHGKVYHRHGSLIPNAGQKPKFAQIIVFDGNLDEEAMYLSQLKRRMEVAGTKKDQQKYEEAKASFSINEEIMEKLQRLLHNVNPYYLMYKALVEIDPDKIADKVVVLQNEKPKQSEEHKKNFALPTVCEVAFCDLSQYSSRPVDIQVNIRGGGPPKRISERNRCFEPLHYVLLFCMGEDGWSYNLHLTTEDGEKKTGDKSTISPNMFHSWRAMDRDSPENPEFNTIIRGGRLFQEWVCGMHYVAERMKLAFVENNQKKIKAEKYQGLMDAVNQNDNIKDVGNSIILPPSHPGSPRFYTEKYADAMAIVRHFGKPDYFITFTADASWSEITESLYPGESSHERPDVVTRVFEMKANELIKDIEDGGVVGRVLAIMVVTEWQKRGLPHIHFLVIVHPDDKPRSADDIDKVVCAEIPDPDTNPLLHKLVKEKMLHGPCHGFNHLSPCMLNSNKKCEKNFPKPYQEQTMTSENGRTIYRRRSAEQGGHLITKTVKGKEVKLGNQWVVPYNPYLLLKYKGHMNFEVCSTTASVKYIYKYIFKGSDKVSLEIKNKTSSDKEKNEIKAFENGRYYCSTQSCHRIFGFAIVYRSPMVMKLQLHLPNEQSVLFEEDDDPQVVLDKFSKTHLTQFFETNRTDVRAHDVLYPDFPKYYTWETKGGKKWKWRVRNMTGSADDDGPKSSCIGRVPIVTLNNYTREVFFLRLLLYHVPGPTSFQNLRTVKIDGQNILCNTYQEACIKLGLTDNDKEAEEALEQAFLYSKASDHMLKKFYVDLVVNQMPSDAWSLFQKFKKELCATEMYKANLDEPTPEIINNVLLELVKLFNDQDKNMADFISVDNMPKNLPKEKQVPREILEETDFDQADQARIGMEQSDSLNDEQKTFVDAILDAVEKRDGGIFAGIIKVSPINFRFRVF